MAEGARIVKIQADLAEAKIWLSKDGKMLLLTLVAEASENEDPWFPGGCDADLNVWLEEVPKVKEEV